MDKVFAKSGANKCPAKLCRIVTVRLYQIQLYIYNALKDITLFFQIDMDDIQ